MNPNTIPDLVVRLTALEDANKKAEEAGEALSDETEDEMELIRALLAGRVDEALQFRAGVIAHIEALEEALAKSKRLETAIENAFESACLLTESKRLEGIGWAVQMKPSGKPTVVIDDEMTLPDAFKFLDVAISERVSVADKDTLRFYASVILKRAISKEQYDALPKEDAEKVAACLSPHVSKDAIWRALKENDGAVPGAHLFKKEHLKFVKGQAKLPSPKAKLAIAKEAANGGSV
jgi:hypothetical protein